ncbi:MAG: hypothetical protein K9M75_10050 [Phycisphaerae bacterium]|nr:hypothetical protein [Phycisphaerae bacterium]
MNYLARIKNIFLILVLMTIFGFCCESFGFEVLGTREALETQDMLNSGSSKPAPRRPVSSRPSATAGQDSKADVATVINDAYSKVVETINAHRRPSKDQIAANEAALHVPMSALGNLDTNMQTKYYILKAWNEYFTDNLRDAQEAAMRAFKNSPSSEDARVTMTSITLLAGEKPVISVKKKTPAKNTDTYQSYNTSSQGTNLLDLDVDSLKTDLTDPKAPEKILPMELDCLNSTTFKYTPGSESLCVIFWKLSEKDTASLSSSEPNNPSARPATARNTQPQYNGGYEDEYAMQSGYNSYGSAAKSQNPTFMSNTEAFKEMFSDGFGMDNVKFLAVNTDTLAAKQKVVEKLMENPWPWANVMAHDPKSRDTQFKNVVVTHEKPLMVITANDGMIRYAGPAVGFLAPMMLSRLTGGGTNATATNTAVSDPSNGQTGVASKIMGLFGNPNPGSDKTTAAKPTTAVNPTTSVNPTAVRKAVDPEPKEMSASDEYAASKLYENAKAFIQMGRSITTPKRGIEMCRELIANYPNTKYSEGARMLLREVPERFRERYGITNEEMGL